MKRKILIDYKYQIRLAASLSIAAVITYILIIAFISSAIYINSNRLDQLVKNQKFISEIQEELFSTMVSFSKMPEMKSINVSEDAINKDMQTNKDKLNDSVSLASKISQTNSMVLMLISGFGLLQTILFFYFIIRRAHRTAGPLFMLNRYISEMKKGTLPVIRKLREKDDFTELFDNFRDMVELLKKHELDFNGHDDEKNYKR